MRFLILSFHAGEGHNAAARALLEAAKREGHYARTVDFLGLIGDPLSRAVNRAYTGMVKHAPACFGGFYKGALAIERLCPRVPSLLYFLSAAVTPQLRMLLAQTGPYDAIIATHLMPAQALSYMKMRGERLPVTLAVATDYTCYPFWREVRGCDLCVIPDRALIPAYRLRGMDASRLRPLGIPIGLRYTELPAREEARRRLGLETDGPLHLLMGGSMGAGGMQRLAGALLAARPENERVIVICGRNRALRETLEKKHACARLHTVGFTEDVPLYMAAADLLYTKPGGLSTAEALAAGIPILYTAPIPGCESDNYKFFTRRLCALGDNDLEGTLRAAARLLSSEALRETVRAQQKRYAHPNAAREIIAAAQVRAGK